jgi:CBS domain-containing protein
MTEGVESVATDCSVQDAARMMKEHNVGMLPVCDAAGLAGVVTDRDIVVRVVAQGADCSKTKVGEIMSRQPAVCYEDANIKVVARMMEGKHIRRIIVLDRDEKMVGLLSLDDFTKRRPGQDMVAEILGAAAAQHH